MSVGVPVAPDVLHWAARRSGRDDSEFERKFPAWHQWLVGEKAPTIKQVEQVARYSHVPFGVFFLTEPPTVELPIPDFRLGIHGKAALPSQELLDVIEACQLRQAWYRDFALANEFGPARVTRLGPELDVTEAALAIADDLQFGVDARKRITRTEARNHLRHAFEDLGGIAVFTSMVGNDNSRPLKREEFRGFTLADDVAPLVFVNTSDDTLSGQLFTFLHEYAHAARGQSGVSDEDQLDRGTVPADGIEQWCNAVAAEVLVPAADLRAEFRPAAPLRGELDRLAARYHASTLTVLIKLRDVGLIQREGFDRVFQAEQRHVADTLAKRAEASGGNHYLNQPFRLGENFSRAVIRETRRGAVSYVEAFRLLGMRSATQLEKYAKSLGMS
ncbi:ImmA/IrrE family metallo-endopeptidase [Agromyces larvae]|uniref:ImmA/IrrE family metallo-endopeptidase n=1 Tax=Agromyces larvae TaxID=2929802 RepID=A0ABY4BZ25_9MICO|nr:ImmA/IrrE family metallo-endopeptidase [Agromyces larvae]UOE44154.1 ImmA/IrrE family metallo-endopeptidase [Agromyces larvae]